MSDSDDMMLGSAHGAGDRSDHGSDAHMVDAADAQSDHGDAQSVHGDAQSVHGGDHGDEDAAEGGESGSHVGSDTWSLSPTEPVDDGTCWDYRVDLPLGALFGFSGHPVGPQYRDGQCKWRALSPQQVLKMQQQKGYVFIHGDGGAGSFLKHEIERQFSREVDGSNYYVFTHHKSGSRCIVRGMNAGDFVCNVYMSMEGNDLLVKVTHAFHQDRIYYLGRKRNCQYLSFTDLYTAVRTNLVDIRHGVYLLRVVGLVYFIIVHHEYISITSSTGYPRTLIERMKVGICHKIKLVGSRDQKLLRPGYVFNKVLARKKGTPPTRILPKIG